MQAIIFLLRFYLKPWFFLLGLALRVLGWLLGALWLGGRALAGAFRKTS